MNRRNFIKRGAIWCPAIVGLKSYPQALTFADPALVPVAAAAGESLKDSYQWGNQNSWSQFSQNYYYTATRFSAAASFRLSRLEVWAEQVGTPTMTLYPYIYTESGGSPGTVLTGGTGTPVALNTAPASGSAAAWDVSGFSCDLTSGTDYWFVHWFNGSYSNANLVRLGCFVVSGLGYWCKRSDNPGGGWNNSDQNCKMVFRAYGS